MTNTTLGAIRSLTASFFDTDTLLYRLLEPLSAFINRCIHENSQPYLRRMGALPSNRARGRRSKRSLKDEVETELIRLRECSSLVMTGTCWIPELRLASTNGQRKDALRELLDLYTMMIQGPVTQFIQSTDVTGLKQLAVLFMHETTYSILQILQDPNTLCIVAPHTNFLASCRIARAAILNVVRLERNINETTGRSARISLGASLLKCAEHVVSFYEFYGTIDRDHSAVKFSNTWSSTSTGVLMQKMKDRFSGYASILPRNDLEIACKSGFYFPSLRQIRPLPFDVDAGSIEQQLGPCTKHYAQNQTSYTPGSITVSCSYPNAVTYGAKVLTKDEGTKAILDTVISRFPAMPLYFVIYDFACGLYNSAVHSLWWSIDSTRIVSDKFHSKNHSCSPGFFPSAYTELDHSNTVSHEQRNRGIAELCKSLRNSSQDFYITLLAYHTMIMNIRSKAKATEHFQQRNRLLSDYDIEWCFFQCLQLKCMCCAGLTNI